MKSKTGYINLSEVNKITIHKIKATVDHPDLEFGLIVNANYIFDANNGVTITFDPQPNNSHKNLKDDEFNCILYDIKDRILKEYCK